MTAFSRRQLISGLISAFFWAVFVTIAIFMPVKVAEKEPEYHEIRIQLSPLPETKVEPVSEPVVEEMIPAVQEAVVVTEAPAPAPKAAEPAPAPAPAAKTPVPDPAPAKQTLVKSVEELMAEQNAAKGSQKKNVDEVDWDSLFGESSTATSSVSTGEKNFASQEGPAISGSAASVSSDAGGQSASGTGKAKDTSVSAGTSDALSSIAGASSNPKTAGSQTGVPGGSFFSAGSDGEITDPGKGTGRRLIKPEKPEITLTDEQKALIAASIPDIRITFVVAADGTVQRNSIETDRKAEIPAAVFQEIERQISGWQFEKGISDGQAVFTYSIIKE